MTCGLLTLHVCGQERWDRVNACPNRLALSLHAWVASCRLGWQSATNLPGRSRVMMAGRCFKSQRKALLCAEGHRCPHTTVGAGDGFRCDFRNHLSPSLSPRALMLLRTRICGCYRICLHPSVLGNYRLEMVVGHCTLRCFLVNSLASCRFPLCHRGHHPRFSLSIRSSGWLLR